MRIAWNDHDHQEGAMDHQDHQNGANYDLWSGSPRWRQKWSRSPRWHQKWSRSPRWRQLWSTIRITKMAPEMIKITKMALYWRVFLSSSCFDLDLGSSFPFPRPSASLKTDTIDPLPTDCEWPRQPPAMESRWTRMSCAWVKDAEMMKCKYQGLRSM